MVQFRPPLNIPPRYLLPVTMPTRPHARGGVHGEIKPPLDDHVELDTLKEDTKHC